MPSGGRWLAHAEGRQEVVRPENRRRRTRRFSGDPRMTPTAYPLTWPDMMPRTKTQQRSQFRTSLGGALKNVRGSIEAFSRDSGKKIENLVISSNVTLGEDKPRDIGVAVWFVWNGLSVCMAGARSTKVEDKRQTERKK